MNFNLCIENHTKATAPAHLTDLVRLLQYGIEANGHPCFINYHLVPTGRFVNLIIQPFDNAFAAKLEALHDQGGHFILIGTDFPGGRAFNEFLDNNCPDNDHEREKSYNNFARAAGRALACWHTQTALSHLYRERFELSRVLPLRQGYHEGLERTAATRRKDIDILFTGTTSPYRTEQLKKLVRLGLKVYREKVNSPDYIREELIERARLALDIRQYPEIPYNSPGRLAYHVINHSAILSERAALTGDMDNFVTHAEPGDGFIEAVLSCLETDLSQIADAAYTRFREERPLKIVFADLLDATFASHSVTNPITTLGEI